MILEPMVLSLIVAKIRKGRFKNLEKIEIKAWYLLLIAAGIQIIASLLKGIGFDTEIFNLDIVILVLHILSYVFMIVCVLLNISKNSMKAFFIGVILNFIVITANGGKMPVSLNGIRGINDNIGTELPSGEFDIKHQGITPDTKLVFLSDIILISEPYPLPKILSIGDIFIMIGLFTFLQESMVINENKNPNCNDY